LWRIARTAMVSSGRATSRARSRRRRDGDGARGRVTRAGTTRNARTATRPARGRTRRGRGGQEDERAERHDAREDPCDDDPAARREPARRAVHVAQLGERVRAPKTASEPAYARRRRGREPRRADDVRDDRGRGRGVGGPGLASRGRGSSPTGDREPTEDQPADGRDAEPEPRRPSCAVVRGFVHERLGARWRKGRRGRRVSSGDDVGAGGGSGRRGVALRAAPPSTTFPRRPAGGRSASA
jgi:hypothetical protein